MFVWTWVPCVLKDSKTKLFLAHFTVTKTDTDIFSQFLVLNASLNVFDTKKNGGKSGSYIWPFSQWNLWTLSFVFIFEDPTSSMD